MNKFGILAVAALAAAAVPSNLLRRYTPKTPKHDLDALAKADAKRQRRAAKSLQGAEKGERRIAEKTRWQLENGARK